MAADASIYSLIQHPKFATPFETAGGAMQLRNLMDANALQGLQRQQLERSMAEEMAVKDLFSRYAGGEVPVNELMSVSPSRGTAYQKSLLENKKLRAEGDKTDAEVRIKLAQYARDGLAQVTDQMSYDAWRADAASKGAQVASNAPAVYDPQWQKKNVVDADKFIAQNTPKLELVTLPDGSQRVMDMNPNTNPQAAGHSAPAAMTPTQRAQLGESQAHNLEMERQGADQIYWNTGQRQPQRQVTLGAPAAAPTPRPAAAPAAAPTPTPAPAPAAPTLTPKQTSEQAARDAERTKEVTRTVNTYAAARDGLLGSLAGTSTGAIVGRMPAVSGKQQTAEGGVAAMAPVLKQIFRVAGEGTFTDKDQEQLMAMVPTRADSPTARKAKMENIDRIIAAKLGVDVPKYAPKAPKPEGKAGPSSASGIKFLGFE